MVNSMKKKKIGMIDILFVMMFLFMGVRLFTLNYMHKDFYKQELKQKTEIIFEGDSAPRGRILDINGEILVDNELVSQIAYHNEENLKFVDLVGIAKELLSFIDFPEAKEDDLKNYYLLKNVEEGNNLITSEERDLVAKRKLTEEDLSRFKKERVTKEMLETLTSEDRKVAYLIQKMTDGYAYQNKILVSEASPEMVALVSEKKIQGIFIQSSWKRSYPYGNTLRSVFGNLAEGVPKEKKEFYLSQGYSLTDTIGISYLEEQYESVLKGKKAKYLVNQDKSLTVLENAERGNDVVLSIDIKLQQKIEEILKETFSEVKKLPNTEFLKESYILIGDPNTGAIKSMVGYRLLNQGGNDSFQDVTTNTFLSSFTSGSIVKGASHTVGYLNNVIDLNKKVRDACVKLYLVPQKCSYKDLGYVDDITALKTSSNYFQFLTAIKITGQKYFYNMKLNATLEDFLKYRSVFADYGLGSKTGIDLPNESIGMIGKTVSDDLLLNLSIGQYDTYTPLQLLQYINTIQNNGVRKSLSLMQEVKRKDGETLKTKEETILSKLSLDKSYYDRIKEGLRQVLYNGTGSGYVNKKYNAYGKTGTAESFYDSDNDGKVDKKTISSTFAMVAPMDNPKYSVVIVTPNISHYDGKKDYTAPMNRILSNKITDYLFS